MSSVILIVIAVAALAWIAVLVASSVRGTDEEVSPNLSPFLSNEELETVRMERVLGVAVVLAGFLAVSLPLYFLTETNRQAHFEEAFAEESVERGAVLFEGPPGLCPVPRLRRRRWRGCVLRSPIRRSGELGGPVAERHPVPLRP